MVRRARRPGRRPGRQRRRACAQNLELHAAASSSARRCCWRWCARAWRARPPTSWCSATRSRAVGGRGRASATLLGADADIAARLDAGGDRPRLRPRTPPAPRRRDHRPRAAATGGDHHEQDRSTKRCIRAQLDKTLGRDELSRAGREVRGQGARLLRARRPAHADRAPTASAPSTSCSGTIPFKGQVLNQMAAFWFEATADLVAEPRHQRARSDGDGRARVRAAAGRVRHARVPDRRDLDVDLDALREGRRARSAATSCPTA